MIMKDGTVMDCESHLIGRAVVKGTTIKPNKAESEDSWENLIEYCNSPETLTAKEIMTNPKYRETKAYEMLCKHILKVDSCDSAGSMFRLDIDGKYDLPEGSSFCVEDMGCFKELGLQFAEGNRDLDKTYVNNLAARMENHVYPAPCIMDVNGVWYDGQSRLASAMLIGKYVYVIIIANPTEDMVIDLNAQSKVWNSDNKIEYYKTKGDENYIRVSDLMHLFDDTMEDIYKPYIKGINATRNTVSSMTDTSSIWCGETKKKEMDLGKFEISAETYEKIKDFITKFFADAVVSLQRAYKACQKREVISQGITKNINKSFGRMEFYQVCLYKMMDLTNRNGERLGDDEKRFRAFIESLDIEAVVQDKTLYGYHLRSLPPTAKDSCTTLFQALVSHFDTWNEHTYYPKNYKRTAFDYASMNFREVYDEQLEQVKRNNRKNGKKSKK